VLAEVVCVGRADGVGEGATDDDSEIKDETVDDAVAEEAVLTSGATEDA